VACITGISGQLEAGSVNMFSNTDRRQIQPPESAWRDQVDSSEKAERPISERWSDFAEVRLP
jgi:hypothetical protein